MAEVVNVTHAKGAGRKPAQWKLVAGLAGVLMLLLAFGGGSEVDDESVAESLALTRPTGTGTRGESSSQREIHWPMIPLDFLLTHNPFHPNSANRLQELTQAASMSDYGSNRNDSVAGLSSSGETLSPGFGASQTVEKLNLALLAAKKVKMIFRSPRGAAAIIDNRVYYEGNRIPDSNYVVVAITQNGVTLRLFDDVVGPDASSQTSVEVLTDR